MIKKYNHFLILEKFDDNIKAELKRLGVTDEDEINAHLYHAHRGNLAKYLHEKGKKFTFGMLNALFKDAIVAKKRTDLKVGAVKMLHRIAPMALAPFFPILAIAGYIFGTSRAFNKIISPILSDPGSEYDGFLKRIIDSSMKLAEGEIPVKDRFTRAFVVSDNLVKAIKPEVLQVFSLELSKKMSEMDPNEVVPEYFIENELKSYLNDQFDIDPEIPLKESIEYENFTIDIKDILRDIEDDGFSIDLEKGENSYVIFLKFNGNEWNKNNYLNIIEHLNSYMNENGFIYKNHKFYSSRIRNPESPKTIKDGKIVPLIMDFKHLKNALSSEKNIVHADIRIEYEKK